ncbi:MAG: hydrogenase iron-sulfur subunit [Myxococcota bacterium]
MLTRVLETRPEPAPRGAALLGIIERAFLRLDRVLSALIPREHNPLTQSGAIANVNFIIAAISGAILLLWYVPSVTQAHSSLEALREGSFLGQLMRSVHRYSSDACMLFIFIHATRMVGERRFGGARWLAWITGVVALTVMGLVGWLGYWLVWDERARLVAVGSSRMLDALPIFSEPISRSFLVDATVNSLLFFVVFFVHMLIPLAMAIVLWLHITRLSRPGFLTTRVMTIWVLVALVVASVVHPATSAPSARMLQLNHADTIDGWYLLPLLLTERLEGGAMWGIALLATMAFLPVPWLLSRRRPMPAQVETSHCNACEQCFKDCPYAAISMVPRTDGRRFPLQALVDPEKCVGCGICAGSCDPSAVNLPWMPTRTVRNDVEQMVRARMTEAETPGVMFLCSSSAGARLPIHEGGRCPDLPGWLVVPLPCAGWLHPLTVERVLKAGALGVLVVHCPGEACNFREGPRWLEQRVSGEREPRLRTTRVDASRVEMLALDASQREELVTRAALLRAHWAPQSGQGPRSLARNVVGGAVVMGAVTLGTVAFSELPHPPPPPEAPLVVSFKHPGRSGENCRTLSEQEKAAMPPHMRRDVVCERGRASVRMRVLVDGAEVLSRTYPPKGLFSDGVSIAVERVDVPPGTHVVGVQLGETGDPQEWTFTAQQSLTFGPRERHAVLFERADGFRFE